MTACPTCNIPMDAGVFDDSRIFQIQTEGEPDSGAGTEKVSLSAGDTIELARFELKPEHCGVLLYFAQFTDCYARDPQSVQTPGYQWAILADDYPIAPWLTFQHIINPWGMAGFPLAQRLIAESTIRLVIRNINVSPTDASRWLRQVGGRIVGRYWFDHEHGAQRALSTSQPWRGGV
jgi:hypothetical protein